MQLVDIAMSVKCSERARADARPDSRRRAFARLLAFFAAAAIVGCIAFPERAEPPRYSAAATCPSVHESSGGPCYFTLASSRFEISQAGMGQRKTSAQNTEFSLPLLEGEWIERLSFVDYQGDVILFVSVTDNGESGGSVVVRLDGETLSPIWSCRIPGFNLSPATIEPGAIYVGAVGLVSRIEPDTGRFEWLHGNLYDSRSGRFNAFEPPDVGSSCVTFRESLAPGMERSEEVQIHKATGERLSGSRIATLCR